MEQRAGERSELSPPHDDDSDDVSRGSRMSRWDPFSVTIWNIREGKAAWLWGHRGEATDRMNGIIKDQLIFKYMSERQLTHSVDKYEIEALSKHTKHFIIYWFL